MRNLQFDGALFEEEIRYPTEKKCLVKQFSPISTSRFIPVPEKDEILSDQISTTFRIAILLMPEEMPRITVSSEYFVGSVESSVVCQNISYNRET